MLCFSCYQHSEIAYLLAPAMGLAARYLYLILLLPYSIPYCQIPTKANYLEERQKRIKRKSPTTQFPFLLRSQLSLQRVIERSRTAGRDVEETTISMRTGEGSFLSHVILLPLFLRDLGQTFFFSFWLRKERKKNVTVGKKEEICERRLRPKNHWVR